MKKASAIFTILLVFLSSSSIFTKNLLRKNPPVLENPRMSTSQNQKNIQTVFL